MLKDDNFRYHSIELMRQLNFMDEHDQLEHLDEIIDALGKRREALRFKTKQHDRIEVKYFGGYYRAYVNGKLQKERFLTEKEAYESYQED